MSLHLFVAFCLRALYSPDMFHFPGGTRTTTTGIQPLHYYIATFTAYYGLLFRTRSHSHDPHGPLTKMTRSFIPYQRRPPQLRQGAHSANPLFPVAHGVRALGEFPPSILTPHDRVAHFLIDEVRRRMQWLWCHTRLSSATPSSPGSNEAVRLVGVLCGESSRLRLIRPRYSMNQSLWHAVPTL